VAVDIVVAKVRVQCGYVYQQKIITKVFVKLNGIKVSKLAGSELKFVRQI
jgi:hypothetical protein